jgi:hypothetical protein
MRVNDGAEDDGANQHHRSPSIKPPRAPQKGVVGQQ